MTGLCIQRIRAYCIVEGALHSPLQWTLPISPCFSYGRGDGYSASLSASEVLHPNPPANKLRASIKNPLKWVENWAFHGKRRTYRLQLIPENCLPPIIKCAHANPNGYQLRSGNLRWNRRVLNPPSSVKFRFRGKPN